jgi:hypothetical protein
LVGPFGVGEEGSAQLTGTLECRSRRRRRREDEAYLA